MFDGRNIEKILKKPDVQEWLQALLPVRSLVQTTLIAFLPLLQFLVEDRVAALRIISLLGERPQRYKVDKS